MRPTLLAAALVLAAAQVEAGAWPRGEGKVFVSVGHLASTDLEAITSGAYLIDGLEIGGYSTLFAEYGLTPKLTFGLDYGSDGEFWTAILFLRRSFEAGRNVFAAEIGYGRRSLWNGETEQVIRPGLHWGRGADWGWIGVETYAEFRSENPGTGYKLDATLGWRMGERSSLVFQVLTARYPGADATVRLAPSYVRRFSEHISVELGLAADVVGAGDVGLDLATWIEF